MSSSERNPWDADHELTQEAVRQAIERVRPNLRPLDVELLGSGWDFWAYLANQRWVFRFPKREEEQQRIRREHAVLPLIARHLQLEIPRYIGPLLKDPAVPYVFGLYEKLDGIQAHRLDPSQVNLGVIGQQLGQTFKRLHAIPRSEVEAAGGSTQRRERDPIETRERSRAFLHWLPEEDGVLCERMQRFCRDDGPLPPRFEGTEFLSHTDPHEEHLLLTPDAPHHLIGLLDWGDVSFADPALDLSASYPWGGEPLLAALLEAYGSADRELEARTRYVGVHLTLLELDLAKRLKQTGASVERLLAVLRTAPL